jgi:hypothetical protein
MKPLFAHTYKFFNESSEVVLGNMQYDLAKMGLEEGQGIGWS